LIYEGYFIREQCVARVKRLERGRFSWPQPGDQSEQVTLSHEELSLLLGGIDLTRVRRKNWYRKEIELQEEI
jgi:hypothetical protein